MFITEQIKSQLETFRFAVGHHIHIHSSLKSVGEVEGRGESLLATFIEFFTQDGGMVSFPTHTWNKNMLDLNRKDTCMGMLSKLALQREDGVRSSNPTHSMVIFGEGAKEYAKWDENIVSSTSPVGCYGKLYDTDGYVLLLGVDQRKNTYIHAVEEMLEIPERFTREFHPTVIVEREGGIIHKPMHLVFEEHGDISRYFHKLESAFRHHGCIADGKIGEADVQLCNARKMKEVLELIHRNSDCQEIFLDDEPLPREWYNYIQCKMS